MKQNIIIALVCLLAGLTVGWYTGRAYLEKDFAEETLKAEQAAREKEQAMQREADELRTVYEKEKKNAETEIADLRKRIQSGTVRLSVPTSRCTVSGNTGAATGQARAELDPETADALVAIAADGDSAIRELNLCIDQYRSVQEKR